MNSNKEKTIEIPIIDIGSLYSNNLEEKLKVSKQLHEAMISDAGFFYVSNHGISVLSELLDITNDFYQRMTKEEKWELAISAYNKENKQQIRNGYYLPIENKKAVESYCYLNPNFTPEHPIIKMGVPSHEVNLWPNKEKYPKFQQFFEDYYWKVFDMSTAILKGIALGLGKEEDFFSKHFRKEDTLSSVKLIRYPYLENYPPRIIAEDGTELNFDSHKDVSLISICYQPFISPLQVEIKGEYFDLPINNDCYLIHVGGYMEYITNQYLKAKIHRVKWNNDVRLCLPFFTHLGYYDELVPFTPFSSKHENSPRTIKYGEYFDKGRVELVVSNGQT